jgi:hypothetical protein
MLKAQKAKVDTVQVSILLNLGKVGLRVSVLN